MRRFTLILSDVHLCGVVRTTGSWLACRQPHALLDDALAALLDSSIESARDGSLEVVLNGDLFDFDAPDITHGQIADTGLYPHSTSHDEACAAQLMTRILDDHPAVVAALGRILQAGHRIVFVPGNHDAQLAFPAVRRVLTRRLVAAARAAGARVQDEIAGRIVIRSWFHRTADGLHIEHGHQYDPPCALSSMLPRLHGERYAIEHTIGSVLSYYAPVLLGCMNLYAVDPFADVAPRDLLLAIYRSAAEGPASGPGYVGTMAHMARELAMAGGTQSETEPLCRMASAEIGIDASRLRRHANLFATPVRADQLVAESAWRTYGNEMSRRLRSAMASIAQIHSPRGVVMGHSHEPHGDWINGVFHGNAGTWAPGSDAGSFVWAVSDGGKLEAQTLGWPRSV